MSSAVIDAVLDCLNANPNANNEAIAQYVRQIIPGANTTAASVATMKSRLKRDSKRTENGKTYSFNFEPASLPESDPSETIEEVKERISIRYDAMTRMTKRLVNGDISSLIISGPPGLGKSYTVNQALNKKFPEGPEYEVVNKDGDIIKQLHYDNISGSISAVGLYQALWNTHKGGILILDDVDDVFRDETALNLLKGALDGSPNKTISWRKEARWLADNDIPDRFQFKGHVVFLTNIDFEQVIQSGRRDIEHFRALIDRSMYLCLTLRTRRDFMIRIRQVAGGKDGMLANTFGLLPEQIEEILDFVTEHQTRFYNLSLRLINQIAVCMITDKENWKKDIEATKMRTLNG